MWEPAEMSRLWRAEAEVATAVAMAVRDAGSDGAAVEALDDGVLVALGPGRYVNRAIGVGPTIDDDDLDVIEGFFADHGLPPSVELSSWAPPPTLVRLAARGYRPEWFRSVFAATAPLPDVHPEPDHIEIVEVDAGNLEDWLQVLAEGNEIGTAEDRAICTEFGLGAHSADGATDLLAIVDGEPAGCGSVQVASGVAMLGAAATRPAHRGRGVQSALIAYRIGLAIELGCELVVSTALPAGSSARNLQRHGLRLIDTQLAVTAPIESR